MPPVITDRLGKASIDNNYAIATTVKTTRTIGVTVLEAFDLSKFSDDTPVYFVTYKKTIDPLTGEVTVSDLVSYKALVNTGANTLTNLTVAPGYTDIGNDVGDFVECIPTSYWENSLVDHIRASTNADGSLNTTAVQAALSLGTDALNGWNPLIPAQSGTIVANGNRSYTVPFASPVAGILSPGMRFRTTRTVAAPTQCTSLSGTTQYYSKTSPAGMTFTDDFVVSAWVKLSSYAAVATIASRYNGTSGWEFRINTSGQVELVGRNAGVGNFGFIQSYQSIPLNKWVHVAAQLDLSTYTNTATTCFVMIDGVNVPALPATKGGTAPTALIQAGNLEIGSQNGGLFPFNGKIAQVAIYSAKVLQATILASINQGLAGTETSLISAYSFNNVITDLNTTSANNLTANGSAVATNADSPFTVAGTGYPTGNLDFGIITAVSSTTITVSLPAGCTIPTTGGVSAVSYSSVKAPFGFPDETAFSLSAYDTVNTTALAATLAKFVTQTPIDGIPYSNTGSGLGTMYLKIQGAEKRVWGKTITSVAAGQFYYIVFPTGFFNTTPINLATGIGSAGVTANWYGNDNGTTSSTVYNNSGTSNVSYLSIGS